MFRNFFIGLTSGCLVGFVIQWIWKKKRGLEITDEVEKNNEVTAIISDNEDRYELALVVNAELKMGEGKIVAQCAHAAIGTYETYYKTCKSNFETWENQGKVVNLYKVSDTSTLKALYKSVDDIGMITCLVRDAGRTQIAAGSSTVLAIGPEKESVLSPITQHLLSY